MSQRKKKDLPPSMEYVTRSGRRVKKPERNGPDIKKISKNLIKSFDNCDNTENPKSLEKETKDGSFEQFREPMAPTRIPVISNLHSAHLTEESKCDSFDDSLNEPLPKNKRVTVSNLAFEENNVNNRHKDKQKFNPNVLYDSLEDICSLASNLEKISSKEEIGNKLNVPHDKSIIAEDSLMNEVSSKEKEILVEEQLYEDDSLAIIEYEKAFDDSLEEAELMEILSISHPEDKQVCVSTEMNINSNIVTRNLFETTVEAGCNYRLDYLRTENDISHSISDVNVSQDSLEKAVPSKYLEPNNPLQKNKVLNNSCSNSDSNISNDSLEASKALNGRILTPEHILSSKVLVESPNLTRKTSLEPSTIIDSRTSGSSNQFEVSCVKLTDNPNKVTDSPNNASNFHNCSAVCKDNADLCNREVSTLEYLKGQFQNSPENKVVDRETGPCLDNLKSIKKFNVSNQCSTETDISTLEKLKSLTNQPCFVETEEADSTSEFNNSYTNSKHLPESSSLLKCSNLEPLGIVPEFVNVMENIKTHSATVSNNLQEVNDEKDISSSSDLLVVESKNINIDPECILGDIKLQEIVEKPFSCDVQDADSNLHIGAESNTNTITHFNSTEFNISEPQTMETAKDESVLIVPKINAKTPFVEIINLDESSNFVEDNFVNFKHPNILENKIDSIYSNNLKQKPGNSTKIDTKELKPNLPEIFVEVKKENVNDTIYLNDSLCSTFNSHKLNDSVFIENKTSPLKSDITIVIDDDSDCIPSPICKKEKETLKSVTESSLTSNDTITIDDSMLSPNQDFRKSFENLTMNDQESEDDTYYSCTSELGSEKINCNSKKTAKNSIDLGKTLKKEPHSESILINDKANCSAFMPSNVKKEIARTILKIAESKSCDKVVKLQVEVTLGTKEVNILSASPSGNEQQEISSEAKVKAHLNAISGKKQILNAANVFSNAAKSSPKKQFIKPFSPKVTKKNLKLNLQRKESSKAESFSSFKIQRKNSELDALDLHDTSLSFTENRPLQSKDSLIPLNLCIRETDISKKCSPEREPIGKENIPLPKSSGRSDEKFHPQSSVKNNVLPHSSNIKDSKHLGYVPELKKSTKIPIRKMDNESNIKKQKKVMKFEQGGVAATKQKTGSSEALNVEKGSDLGNLKSRHFCTVRNSVSRVPKSTLKCQKRFQNVESPVAQYIRSNRVFKPLQANNCDSPNNPANTALPTHLLKMNSLKSPIQKVVKRP